jgi:hypothetical protein
VDGRLISETGNTEALNTRLIMLKSQASKAKDYLYSSYLKPLARHIDSHYYWTFIDIIKIHKSILEVMDSSDEEYIPQAINFFNKLLALQKFVISLIMPLQQMMEQMPKVYEDLINIQNQESIVNLWIDRSKILAALKQTENLAKIIEFNNELLQLIKNCIKVYTPFHAECAEEKLDEKNQAARALMQELKLSSYDEIIEQANSLHAFFNRDYFVTECVSNLYHAPAQAIIFYKRFFLSLELAVLILYKLINQLGHNSLSGNVAYVTDMRLIKNLVDLKFKFDGNRNDVNVEIQIDSFHQRNLFNLTLNCDVMFKAMISAYNDNPSRLGKMRKMVEFAKQFSGSRKFIRNTLKKLHEQADLNDSKIIAPTRLEYVQRLIDDTRDFFNNDQIKSFISYINAANANRKFLEDTFFAKLKTTVMKAVELMIATNERVSIPRATLDFFDFEIINNKLQLKKAEHCENCDINNFIKRDSICKFVNKFNPADPSGYEDLKQNILALDYIETGLNYCLDYDNKNAKLEQTLHELNLAICGSKKPVAKAVVKSVAKTEEKLSQPKIHVKTKIDAEENFKLLLKNITAEYSDFTKKMREFQVNSQQTSGVLQDDTNKLMAELSAASTTLHATIQHTSYSAENAKSITAASAELNALQLKLKKAMTNLTNTISYQHTTDSNSFQVIHTKLDQGFKEYNSLLSEAEKKLRGLKKHAVTKNGKTDKPLFPGFDEVIVELAQAAEPLPAAIQLTQYTKENMIVITAARDNLDVMQAKLQVLISRLCATENYFYGKAADASKKNKDNSSRPSRTLG